MNRLCLLGFCTALLTVGMAVAQDAPEWKSIFNGENLDGWNVPEGNIWWSVEEGAIVVQSGPKQKGSTLWTSESYTDFIIELEFRMGKDGVVDSGVFLRNKREQIQIGISGSKKRDMTASPYISGRGYPVEAEGVADLLKPVDWNTLKIRAVGPAYTAWLNGKEVMNYSSKTAAERGPVGLQLHAARNMRIEFRAIRLAKL